MITAQVFRFNMISFALFVSASASRVKSRFAVCRKKSRVFAFRNEEPLLRVQHVRLVLERKKRRKGLP